MKRISLVLLVLSAGLWLGCGRSTTVTGPEGEEVTVTEQGDGTTVTIEGQDGQSDLTFTKTGDGDQVTATFQGDDGQTVHVVTNEKGVELPDDFPADVPVYPGGTITGCVSSGDMLQLTIQTADSLQEAKAFYLDKLREQGWTLSGSMDIGQVISLAVSKDQREIGVTITSGDASHTMIMLHMEKKGE